MYGNDVCELANLSWAMIIPVQKAVLRNNTLIRSLFISIKNCKTDWISTISNAG